MNGDPSDIDATARGPLGSLATIWTSGPPTSRILLGLAVFSAVCVAVVIAALPVDVYLETLAIDDALYYPVIAHSIASGDGSSIDGGITYTNGYHPLWCWLQAILALPLIALPFGSFLWVVKLLISLVTLAAIGVWSRVVFEVVRSALAVAVFVVLSGAFWGWSIGVLYGGLETSLVLLGCGLVLLHTTAPRAQADRRYFVVLGVLAGLTMLARLDSVFFIACVMASELRKAYRAGSLRAFLSWAPTTSTLVVAPYLLHNRFVFGSFVPVSGLKKTPDVDLGARWHRFSEFVSTELGKLPHGALVAFVCLVVLAAALAVPSIRRRAFAGARTLIPLLALFAGALLHFVYTNVFMTEGWVGWYQYLERFTAYALVAIAFGTIAAMGRRAALGASLIALALFAMVGLRTQAAIRSAGRPNTNHAAIIEVAKWARDALPDDARVGMYDSGLFRVISERQTMALNGLAGDHELLLLSSSLPLEERARKLVERYALDYVVTFGSKEEIAAIADPASVLYVSKNRAPTFAGSSHWFVVAAQCYIDASCHIPAR